MSREREWSNVMKLLMGDRLNVVTLFFLYIFVPLPEKNQTIYHQKITITQEIKSDYYHVDSREPFIQSKNNFFYRCFNYNIKKFYCHNYHYLLNNCIT